MKYQKVRSFKSVHLLLVAIMVVSVTTILLSPIIKGVYRSSVRETRIVFQNMIDQYVAMGPPVFGYSDENDPGINKKMRDAIEEQIARETPLGEHIRNWTGWIRSPITQLNDRLRYGDVKGAERALRVIGISVDIVRERLAKEYKGLDNYPEAYRNEQRKQLQYDFEYALHELELVMAKRDLLWKYHQLVNINVLYELRGAWEINARQQARITQQDTIITAALNANESCALDYSFNSPQDLNGLLFTFEINAS